jgi:ribosomal protein L11 methyltransferase
LLYPALDVHGDADRILAIVDDYSPTAVEEHDGFLSVFFSTADARAAAREAIARAYPDARVAAREVDDEDWARRSQENLGPVTVGRITIAPPWADEASLELHGPSPGMAAGAGAEALPSAEARPPALSVTLIVQPSMAFGTGHHATTRLCLVALQMLNLSGTFVLDVGTGSGVIAIAARALGAVGALGIDNDPDAIACARENLALNPHVDHVRFALGDVSAAAAIGPSALYVARGLHPLGPPDVITANLTGDLLCRTAPVLGAAFAPGGALVVSGVLVEERDQVVAAFGTLDLVWEMEEDGWVGLGFARLS